MSYSFEIFITHVESRGAVLKVCGQRDTKTAIFVEKNIESLKESFESGNGVVRSANQLIPSIVCCARYKDSKYYRARIIHVDTNSWTVRVNFIDYGNTEDIPASDIRLLDNYEVLNLVKLDALVSEFYLANARPITAHWGDDLIECVKDELMNSVRKCSVIADLLDKKFIIIDFGNEDYAKYLIRRGYAMNVPVETQLIQLKAEDDIRSVKFSAPPPMPISMIQPRSLAMNQQRPVYAMHSQPIPKSMLTHSGPLLRMVPPQVRFPNQQYVVAASGPTPQRFQCDLIEEDSEHSIYVSHVEGPHLFTVQLKSIAENKLLKMMQRLNAIQTISMCGPIHPGSLCLGRFTGDNTLYRAVVVEVDDDKCKVFYVDFGNSELLTYSEIYQLPDEFQSMKLMAHRFSLANIKSMNITTEFGRVFKEYVKEKVFTMRVTPAEERAITKQYCELYYHGRNIKEIVNEIVEKNRATPVVYAKATLPARGSTVRVFVSHVDAVTKIFVQLIDEQDTLTTLMSEIANHCSDRSLTTFKANQLKPGMPVCAYYSDCQWYRAQILSVNEVDAKVLFVDYGNIDSVPISSLRYISPDLVKNVEAQAIECCLAGYETSDPNEALNNSLYDLIIEKSMAMKVFGILIDDVLIVEFFDDDNTKISSFLLPTMLPGFSQPVAPEPVTYPVAQPVPAPAPVDDWQNNKEESFYEEEAPPVRLPKGRDPRIGSGSFKDRGDFDSSKSRPFNSDNQNFSRQASQDEDGLDNQKGGRYKPRDDFNSQRGGGRFDKQRDEDSGRRDFGGGGSDSWRQKKDRDDFGSGGNWRNKNDSEDKGDWGKKSFKSDDDRGSWRKKDSDQSDFGDNKRSGGGFQSKSSWKSRDGDSNDNDSSWKSKDKFGDSQANKWDRDSKFDSSRGDSFKSQKFDKFGGGSRYDDGDSGYKGGKRDYGDKGSWRTGSSSYSKPAAPKKLTVPKPSMKVGDRELVEVVYSLSPVDFYVQATKQNAELTDLMAKIADQYAAGGTVQSSVNEGDYCIAQYKEDEVWYRALVKSSLYGNITVQFIDYGNSEEVSPDQVKEITSDLCTLPAQAVKCSLLGATSESGAEWSDEKLTEFSLASENKTLEAHIISKDFSADLLKSILRDLSNPDEEVVINYQFGATDEVLNSVTPPTPGEVINFSPFPIEFGSTLEVQITWVMSPHQFYVQPLFCNAEFRQMMDHLNRNVKNVTLLGEYEQNVDKSVLTYFKEDKAVYRAIIKESGKVLFVDYGNDEKIDKSHTWAVEPEYSIMPCQAVECTLAGVKPFEAETWPAPKTTKIESFFEGDSYMCTFHSMSEDGKVLVKLELNGISVADQLVDNQLASVDESTLPQTEDQTPNGIQLRMLPGQVVRAKVIVVKDTATIYVQLLPEQSLAIYEQIAATVEDGNLKKLEKENILPGTGCLIKTENYGYQRAWVWDNSDESNISVELIDQGGCIKIGIDEVYVLPDVVAVEPGFAYECTFKPKEDMELDKMKENYENKSVILYVKTSEVPNRLTVTVYDTNGSAVSELIEGENKNINVICPLSIFKKQQKMIISHAENGAVYLQRKADGSAIIDLITKLYDHYESAELSTDKAWTTEMMCAAKSSADDQWYRAQIVNIEDDLVNVCYIDYGNSELISTERIAVLDESFLADNMYAVKVALPVQWLVGEENLLENFSEKAFNTHFLRVNDSWLVNMIDEEGVDLIKKIAELELGTEMEDSPFKKVEVSSRISKFNEGGSFKVCRVHVLSPSQFWVVLSDDFEKVESLQDRLQNLAAHMRPINKNSLQAQEGVVAAKFADSIWYRASYNFEADTVFSVDYGNTESCTGELKELSEDLIEPDGFAIECALKIQPATESDWDSETKSLFDSLIPDDEIIINVLKNNGTNILVDITVKDESISHTLISKGLAIEPPVTAYISHINSPSDFYIQQEDNQLDKISDSLLAAEEFVVIEDIQTKKESVFAAKFSCDGLWYRAKYLDEINDGAKVLFVDYGNTDDAQHFRELPEELATLPFSAKHCSLLLKDTVTDWSEVLNAKERFEEILGSGSTAFEVRIISEGDPSIVNLLLDGQSVSDTLMSVANQETQPEDEELTLRTKAIISHINSPSDFYVQFENSPLESVSTQLMNADKWNILTNVEENSIVAALFEDSVWYRAQVMSKSDEVVTVMFIDYGNVAPALEVRELPEDLKEIAPLAEHCRLKLPLGVLEWSQESINQFSEMLGYGSVPVAINFLTSDDVPKTVQLTVNDEDVGKHIAKFCKSKEKVECSDNGQTVVVCHINSPKDFFVHLDLEAVDEMATKLLGANMFEACDSEIIVGSVVAACFKDDEQWYRATVISKAEDGSGYKVQFIDYGNTAIAEEFLKLSSDLTDIPALAKWCCLNSPKTFSPEATDKFRDLAMDGVQEFEMITIDENTTPISVDLIFNGEHLNKILPFVNLEEECTDEVTTDNLSQANKAMLDEEITSDDIENSNTDLKDSTNKVGTAAEDKVVLEDPVQVNCTPDETIHDIENESAGLEESTKNETATEENVVLEEPIKENSISDETVHHIENPTDLEESIIKVTTSEVNKAELKESKDAPKSDEIVNSIENPSADLGESTRKFTVMEENKAELEDTFEETPKSDETVHSIENPSADLGESTVNFISVEENKAELEDTFEETPKSVETVHSIENSSADLGESTINLILVEENKAELEDTFEETPKSDETVHSIENPSADLGESTRKVNVMEENKAELKDSFEETPKSDETVHSIENPSADLGESTRKVNVVEGNKAELEDSFEETPKSDEIVHSIENLSTDLGESNYKVTVEVVGEEAVKDSSISKNIAVSAVSEYHCPKEMELEVSVCYINNPNDFYVTNKESIEEITLGMEEASNFEIYEPSEDINLVVAARFVEDDLWYRVRIISKAENSGYQVLFIDYGNTDTASDFRKLPENLSKIPAQAKHCSLNIPSELLSDITEEFKVIADSGVQKFSMKYINENTSPCLVELFLADKAVSEILLYFCKDELNDYKLSSEGQEKQQDSSDEITSSNNSTLVEENSVLQSNDSDGATAIDDKKKYVSHPSSLLTDAFQNGQPMKHEELKKEAYFTKTPFSEKIVPGALGSGRKLEQDEKEVYFTKTPFSEKIVPGAVGSGRKLEQDEEVD